MLASHVRSSIQFTKFDGAKSRMTKFLSLSYSVVMWQMRDSLGRHTVLRVDDEHPSLIDAGLRTINNYVQQSHVSGVKFIMQQSQYKLVSVKLANFGLNHWCNSDELAAIWPLLGSDYATKEIGCIKFRLIGILPWLILNYTFCLWRPIWTFWKTWIH